MPAEGGEALTVARLYGGQGTINVNSWSPDSGNIAFVSYAEPDDKAPSDPDR
jgi:Tol biopolymer transport system component